MQKSMSSSAFRYCHFSLLLVTLVFTCLFPVLVLIVFIPTSTRFLFLYVYRIRFLVGYFFARPLSASQKLWQKPRIVVACLPSLEYYHITVRTFVFTTTTTITTRYHIILTTRSIPIIYTFPVQIYLRLKPVVSVPNPTSITLPYESTATKISSDLTPSSESISF